MRPGTHAGDPQFPDAAATQRAHGVLVSVPAVEVADHGNTRGMRRPHGKGHAAVQHVRAEHLPQLLVPPLSDEVAIQVADGRQTPVGVFQGGGGAAGPGDFEDVGVYEVIHGCGE